MTHPADIVEEALALARLDLPATEIARRTGVPRRTVADWVNGRTPTRDAERSSLPPTAESYAYLLGLYLGDGCLARHPRGVYKLRITLDAKYPGIIAEARTAIDEVLGRPASTQRARTGDVEVYAYSKRWPDLFPQHGPGKKHHRPIELVTWQQQLVDAAPGRLLRGLIHSDGCRFINTGRNWTSPRYSFSNRSDDIRAIFRRACDQLGLHWTEAPHTVYVSRQADVAVLDQDVGPKS